MEKGGGGLQPLMTTVFHCWVRKGEGIASLKWQKNYLLGVIFFQPKWGGGCILPLQPLKFPITFYHHNNSTTLFLLFWLSPAFCGQKKKCAPPPLSTFITDRAMQLAAWTPYIYSMIKYKGNGLILLIWYLHSIFPLGPCTQWQIISACNILVKYKETYGSFVWLWIPHGPACPPFLLDHQTSSKLFTEHSHSCTTLSSILLYILITWLTRDRLSKDLQTTRALY